MAKEHSPWDAKQKDVLQDVGRGWHRLSTFLTHVGRPTPHSDGVFVNHSVARGSTVLFPSISEMNADGEKAYQHQLVYGAMGNPVQHELEKVLTALEEGLHTQVVSSGLAACTVALLAFLGSGDHLLLPDSVYGPTRRFAMRFLTRFGVETSFYPPMAEEDQIRALIQPNTRVIFAESPGSHTFEVQDIPMLARVAQTHGARLLLDNTWGIGAFKPFDHGVDVSIQALTKYPSGHADVVIGAIIVSREDDWKRLRSAAIEMGECAGADDCWLTLRGLRTMAVRLEQQSRSALSLARWLKERPEVARVRHPALPDCPGHHFWKRDFIGASGLFGVELKPEFSASMMERMLDSFHLFGIGASWGSFESLVLPTTGGVTRTHPDGFEGPAFRVSVGLEDVQDLKEDFVHAFRKLME